MEETSFRKVVAKAVVQPKSGFAYFVNTKTGDVVETDVNHPDYIVYKKAKDEERKAKKAEVAKKRAERKKVTLANIEAAEAKLKARKEALMN